MLNYREVSRVGAVVAGALLLADTSVRPQPLLTGGGQERGLRSGTENVAAIAGFGAAAEVRGKLLVVDDDPANLDLLARRLEQAGHEVVTADGGVEALRLIEDGEFDIVMLDVLMPEMSGLEVLDTIRRRRSESKLPVILATALGGSEDVVEGLRARGHEVEVGKRNWSAAEAIVVDGESGWHYGGNDPRRDGLALGFSRSSH